MCNIDVLKDEIKVLNAELRDSDDPAAQKRIKEMIDERETVIGEIEFHNACETCVEDQENTPPGSTRLAPAPHYLKTCNECGSLIDAAEAGENVDIYVCFDCDARYIFPPGVTRAACPFVFGCVRCKSFTEYDADSERYSCQNSECDNFNKMKRPEDIDFGEYYGNPITR